jgi:hypothetical protein
MVYTKVGTEKHTDNKGITIMIAAYLLVSTVIVSSYGISAYADPGREVKPASSDAMFFRILKGDLNVCTADYKYNITVCQMVMKEGELSPYGNGSVTNANNTNNSNYPPLSTDPEMVVTEQELQEMLTNHSLGTFEGAKYGLSNDTSPSNATIAENLTKIYVDGYSQIKPVVSEQPLEDAILNNTSLQSPMDGKFQPLVTEQPPEDEILNNTSLQYPGDDKQPQQRSADNQTLVNEASQFKEDLGHNEGLDNQDNYQGPTLDQDSSVPHEDTDNSKADTSNSYSSIPIAISSPLTKNN